MIVHSLNIFDIFNYMTIGRQAPQPLRQEGAPQEGTSPPPRQGTQEALRTQGTPRTPQGIWPQEWPS